MNTKWILTVCAFLLGASGIGLTFAPDLVIESLGVKASKASLLLAQITGGL